MSCASFEISPIGFFECKEIYTYDVPRQGTLAGDNIGVIRLLPDMGFEQALYRLDSFSHIWVLFIFNRNTDWRPMILPPRHTTHKVGVFASRSPYRPSGIGMCCVKLLGVKGLEVHVQGHDLLDGTPIIDIKPYLPYADSFPDATPGWTGEKEAEYIVRFTAAAEAQIEWLEEHGVACLRQFILDRLGTSPLDRRRNRLCPDMDGLHVLAYRTWRALFSVEESTVTVSSIRSGYTTEELASSDDKYGDKQLHRMFPFSVDAK